MDRIQILSDQHYNQVLNVFFGNPPADVPWWLLDDDDEEEEIPEPWWKRNEESDEEAQRTEERAVYFDGLK